MRDHLFNDIESKAVNNKQVKSPFFDLWNGFYSVTEGPCATYKPTAAEAYVFFTLLHFCNKKRWEQPLQIYDVACYSNIGMSDKTFIKARKVLIREGFIKYKPGNKKRPSLYWFIDRKNSDQFEPKTIDRSEDGPENKPEKFRSYKDYKTKEKLVNRNIESIEEKFKAAFESAYQKLNQSSWTWQPKTNQQAQRIATKIEAYIEGTGIKIETVAEAHIKTFCTEFLETATTLVRNEDGEPWIKGKFLVPSILIKHFDEICRLRKNPELAHKPVTNNEPTAEEIQRQIDERYQARLRKYGVPQQPG